ncbi:hypothetical protein [Streptomyces microflavus]|uniref:hypothetical protein n=1 Tax=Streptomyces microflavus TaxID=1919 RepID=UPI003645F99C
MPRLAALLVPLVLLTASACVSVPAAGRPATSPAVPAPAAAAYTPPSAPPPSQAPGREELARMGDDKPRAAASPRARARQAPAAPGRRTGRPEESSPQRPRAAVRPGPADAPPRKKPQRARPNTVPAYEMRTLCRSAARSGVGQSVVGLCRSTYGR